MSDLRSTDLDVKRWPIIPLALLAACITQQSPHAPLPAPVSRGPAITFDDSLYFFIRPLMVPVHGVSPDRLRDSFDEPRSGGRTHNALDILAPRNTPVLAAIGGSVLALRKGGAGGITIYLTDSERRYVYYYAHLERHADGLTAGMPVERGSVIGFVGTTGNAPPNTPHLHFQVMRLAPNQREWWNAPPVDARTFITIAGAAAERAADVGDSPGPEPPRF